MWFFFQTLNVYSRKTCTIVLFKVLSIWSYDFLPSFWQFVDSIPEELRRLGGQEWIKPIFDTLLWCKTYPSGGVLHRPEHMVVRRGNVWAIVWPRVWSHIPGVFRLLLSSNILIVFGSVLHWCFYPVLAAHNTADPSDPTKYSALHPRHGYSAMLLIWLVGRVSHMIFCAWGYRNGSSFHHQ